MHGIVGFNGQSTSRLLSPPISLLTHFSFASGHDLRNYEFGGFGSTRPRPDNSNDITVLPFNGVLGANQPRSDSVRVRCGEYLTDFTRVKQISISGSESLWEWVIDRSTTPLERVFSVAVWSLQLQWKARGSKSDGYHCERDLVLLGVAFFLFAGRICRSGCFRILTKLEGQKESLTSPQAVYFQSSSTRISSTSFTAHKYRSRF